MRRVRRTRTRNQRSGPRVSLCVLRRAGTPKGGPEPSLRGVLNPEFVEWLMGLPIGWTSVAQTGSASSVEAWSRYKRRLRSLASRVRF